MGFMDKAREAAQQATTKAQQGLAQGQAKLDDVQASRAADGLLRDLGTAFYAEQRTGGSREAVELALGAIDAHVTANGPLGQKGSGSSGSAPQPPAQPSAPPASPATGPPSGTAAAGPPSGAAAAGPPSGAAAAGPPSEPSAGAPTPGGFTLEDI